MANRILLSAVVCLAFAASSYSLYPPGWIVIPTYNVTLNYSQPSGPCQYPNTPEYNTHSVYKGCATLYDRLLFLQNFAKDASWFRGREKMVDYPVNGVGLENITAIRIRDRIPNGQGGFATIVAGGIGQKFCKIRMTSPRNKSFDFEVRIYGR